jgi:7,8-dihydropterin-6-yl-methyl-4-(beta-D-ribofuranosyl)aminobenzene 5'-phosphate synthase
MNPALFFAILTTFFSPCSDSSAGGPFASAQDHLTVTILFDNTAARDDLETGWGFAALIESPGHTVLFDTGADGEVLTRNMRALGKDPFAIQTVVISHAHSDHTGGLGALFDLGLRPVVVLLEEFPDALRSSFPDGVTVELGAPGNVVAPGIRTTGTVGTAIPEQALILDTGLGTVVLTGCAHPGPVAMTERAAELSAAPLHLVAGGFHLLQASQEQVQAIIQDFRRLGVARAGATHCTGEPAIEAFRSAYGDDFQPLGAGRILTFPLGEG